MYRSRYKAGEPYDVINSNNIGFKADYAKKGGKIAKLFGQQLVMAIKLLIIGRNLMHQMIYYCIIGPASHPNSGVAALEKDILGKPA